jgi:hypothetical protein
MPIEFIPTHPDQLPFEALKYLSSALNEDTKLSDVLDEARRDEGTICVIRNGEVIGAMYLQLYPNVLNIIHLSTKSIQDLKDDLPVFVKKTMKDCGVENLVLVSRIGLHKIFKDLTYVGALYHMGGMRKSEN